MATRCFPKQRDFPEVLSGDISNRMLHSAHYMLHTAHRMLHTAHCMLHTAHCMLHTAHRVIHSTHWTLIKTHVNLHTQHCKLFKMKKKNINIFFFFLIQTMTSKIRNYLSEHLFIWWPELSRDIRLRQVTRYPNQLIVSSRMVCYKHIFRNMQTVKQLRKEDAIKNRLTYKTEL